MRENQNASTEAARAAAQDLAERVRAACVRAALEAWEDAGIRGLCGDGRWEFAVDAMRQVDLALLIGDGYDRSEPTGRKA